MYLPEIFSVKDPDLLYDWIEHWSFGTLVTSHRGRLESNLIPFVLDRERKLLMGHVARPNKHWQALINAEDLLITFNGPHAYVSPSWYNTPGGVPTWNFVSVQVRGRAELIKTEQETLDMLRSLTNANETLYGPGWRMEDMDQEKLRKMLQGIVGFRIHIKGIEGKAKLSQNRSRMDQVAVIRELSTSQDSQVRELALLMRQNLTKKDPE